MQWPKLVKKKKKANFKSRWKKIFLKFKKGIWEVNKKKFKQ